MIFSLFGVTRWSLFYGLARFLLNHFQNPAEEKLAQKIIAKVMGSSRFGSILRCLGDTHCLPFKNSYVWPYCSPWIPRMLSLFSFPKQCLHYGVLAFSRAGDCEPPARGSWTRKITKKHLVFRLFQKKRCWLSSCGLHLFVFRRMLELILLFLLEFAFG